MPQLTLKATVPSPLVLRDMLEEMAVKELQGPSQGDEEEVSERIRDRYLVGILAPRQRAEDMPLPLFEKPAAPPAEDDDNLEGDFPPGEELGIEGVGRGNLSGDDGPTELSAPMSKAVYPSSLGLSFCVPLETTSLKVTTRWGHYDKNPSEFLTNPKTGTPKRVWKRRPCGGVPHEIPLQAGSGRTHYRRRVIPRRQDQGADPSPPRPLERHPLLGQRRHRAAAPEPGADLDVPARDGGRGT